MRAHKLTRRQFRLATVDLTFNISITFTYHSAADTTVHAPSLICHLRSYTSIIALIFLQKNEQVVVIHEI
jgi:hypothetical protein